MRAKAANQTRHISIEGPSTWRGKGVEKGVYAVGVRRTFLVEKRLSVWRTFTRA